MNDSMPAAMSPYELKRWEDLQVHWSKKAKRKQLLPPRAIAALETTGRVAKETAARAGRAIADVAPERAKDWTETAVDAALVPAVHSVVHLLELVNDWAVELSDPEEVLRHHHRAGRDVASLDDLKSLDLEHLDEFTDGMSLRWRTLGAGEGAALGALAMIPVPVVSSVAAISLDLLVMQVLTSAIATRVCYAYGFDAADPEMKHMIERMVVRAYRNQMPKAGAVKNAGAAFQAAKGRVNWSKKLREDHRLMAAVENLLKRVGDGGRVSVKNARMGLPLVAVFVGAGTNSHILGDTAKQARYYAATVFLAEKHGLELPPNIRRDLDADLPEEGPDDGGV